MLRKEQNDLVTQTGPGTPDGPAVPQLLDSGSAGGRIAGKRLSPPVRVKLLSERLRGVPRQRAAAMG